MNEAAPPSGGRSAPRASTWLNRIWRTAVLAFAALSAFLLLAILVAWLRSYWANDMITIYWRTRTPSTLTSTSITFQTPRGGFLVNLRRSVEDDPKWGAELSQANPPTRGVTRSTHPPIPIGGVGIFRRGGSAFNRFGLEFATDFRPGYMNMDFTGGFYRRSPERLWGARAPYAVLILLLAILPVLQANWLYRRLRSRRRMRHGLCAVCGYDLRASARRCPECGADIESDQPAISNHC